jgi:hypothetical protein
LLRAVEALIGWGDGVERACDPAQRARRRRVGLRCRSSGTPSRAASVTAGSAGTNGSGTSVRSTKRVTRSHSRATTLSA